MSKKKIKRLFTGFLKDWQLKLTLGVLYTILAFLILCLIAVLVIFTKPVMILAIIIFIAISYVIGHFSVRGW